MDYKEFLEEWRDKGKDFIEVLTSGSTGTPKSIRLDKNFVRESARRTIDFFRLNSESLLYSCISPDYIGGKMMGVRADVAQCKLLWEKPSNDPLSRIDKIDRPISLLAVVPSQMVGLLERKQCLPAIENIIIGGSAINKELCDRIKNSGLNAYETYGMTETASHIALRKVGDDKFYPLPGIGLSKDDRHCLVIEFEGREKIITNDMAELFPDGGFRIKGRIDNVIISGGKKINPEEIEEKLKGVIDTEFYIKGEKDYKWGEKVVLVIEGDSTEDTDAKLLNIIRKELNNWEIPKKIIHVGRIDKTPGGKIKRL